MHISFSFFSFLFSFFFFFSSLVAFSSPTLLEQKRVSHIIAHKPCLKSFLGSNRRGVIRQLDSIHSQFAKREGPVALAEYE